MEALTWKFETNWIRKYTFDIDFNLLLCLSKIEKIYLNMRKINVKKLRIIYYYYDLNDLKEVIFIDPGLVW